MGARKWSDKGTWEGLWDMGFIISAKNGGDARDLDEGDVYTYVSSADADLCGRRYPVEWLPGSQPTVWSGAVPIKSAGSATVNSQIWWESTQYHGAYTVRVYWDCVTLPCTRTITIINNLNTVLESVRLLMTWDLDISPTPRHEPVYMTGSSTVSWGSFNAAKNSVLDVDGTVQDIDINLVNSAAESCDGFPNYASPAGMGPGSYETWDQYCDGGAAVVVPLLDLEEGQAVSITTTFLLSYGLPIPTGRSIFQFVSGHVDEIIFDNSISGWVAAPYVFYPSGGSTKRQAGPSETIPGDCPCFGNSTCTIGGIHPPCLCDSHHYGQFCESECGEGGIWDSERSSCECLPGWHKEMRTPLSPCVSKCECNRGSYCDPGSGECYCKNGFTGDHCDKLHTCPRQ